jgi:hypothetical protein
MSMSDKPPMIDPPALACGPVRTCGVAVTATSAEVGAITITNKGGAHWGELPKVHVELRPAPKDKP